MKYSVKLLFIGAVISVLIPACRPNIVDSSQDHRNNAEEDYLDELPEEIRDVIAQEEALPEFPIMIQLDLSPGVVGPGDLVRLTNPPSLNGTVTITHGSYTESFDLSSDSVKVPSDAPDGVYSLLLENEEVAIGFGTFRVASSPGIWLSGGAEYVSSVEYVEIEVIAYEIPQDLVGIFLLGDLVQDEFSDEEYNEDFEVFDPFTFNGPSAYLLPANDNKLQLGSFPGLPLSEMVDQTLLLPGRFANRIQVYALDSDLAQLISTTNFDDPNTADEDFMADGMELVSNIVIVQQCNFKGEIHGDLGGPGMVRAISYDGELITRTVSSTDGGFTIQLPAGSAFVEGWQESEEGMIYFPRQAVEVPCGEIVQLSFAASSPHLASIIPAIHNSRIAAQAGNGDEVCERIYVNTPGALPDGFENPSLLTSAYAAQLDASLSRASVATYYDVQSLQEESARDQWEGGDGQQEFETIAKIRSANIVIFSYVYRLGGEQFASVAAFDKSGGWSTSFARAVIFGESIQELSRLPDSFVEKVQKAAVCASVEPAETVIGPNETVDLRIEMTDLNGEAHEQVEISLESQEPLCGSLEWTEQAIDGTSAPDTYTANDELSCSDTLVFVGETDGPQGKIKSIDNDGKVKILKPLLFHFNMKMVFYGENGGTIDFDWDTDFYADEDQTVKTAKRSWDPNAARGAFTSQGIHCEVHENGVLTFRSEDLKPNASWDLELGGEMEVFENGFVDVRLIPVGTSWDLKMQPFPEECTLLIENIFIWFIKSLSLQPANFVPGGAIEFGGLTDEPLKVNIPLEGSSGFNVTITMAPVQARQP